MTTTTPARADAAVVERVLAAIAGMNLPPASVSSDIEASDAYFSIIARRSGASLTVHAAAQPTIFAALAHARPQAKVSLGKGAAPGAEVLALRDAANALAVPDGARAIPFTLVTSAGASHVKRTCGVALAPAARVEVVLNGRAFGPTVPTQAIAFAAEEVAVVELDDYSARFGTVVLRRPLAEVTCVDIDERSLGIEVGGARHAWQLIDAAADAIADLRALCARRGMRTRRLAQVDPTTRAWTDD